MADSSDNKQTGDLENAVKPSDLDTLIHERLRLGILSALAVRDEVTFTELRSLLGATDGNLSVQSRRLEEAGYIECIKQFENRRPKTLFKLTDAGRSALEDYLALLEQLLPPRLADTKQDSRSDAGDGHATALPA